MADRSLGCPLGRVAGQQVVSASTSLGTYGMGSYGAFGLGLVLMPDLAACPTYRAKVRSCRLVPLVSCRVVPC